MEKLIKKNSKKLIRKVGLLDDKNDIMKNNEKNRKELLKKLCENR